MQASNIPGTKFPVIWANDESSTYVRPVPVASQIGIQNGAASWQDGFPPNTFVPAASGGVGPDGRDMNGVLQAMSAWLRWSQTGAPIPYDSSFQSAIGGYPKGAVVLSITLAGVYWQSTTDNNTTNPDAAGAGWQALSFGYSQTFFLTASSSFTVPLGKTLLEVMAIGGGAGGAGCINGTFGSPYSSGGGGGAGGVAWGILAVTPGQVIYYTIGAGGLGGVGTSAPGAGGATTFSSFAGNGGGAPVNSNNGSGGGNGGTASVPSGGIAMNGGYGSEGGYNSFIKSGNGADGPFGGKGRSGTPNGVSAGAPGAGGGGAYAFTNGVGGNGSAGAIIIRC